MPRLYGLMIARDEADIIEQSLTHALGHCDKIICMDNNSRDQTWAIMQNMASRYPGRVIAYCQLTERFRDSLRSHAYNAFHKELSANDWWLRLDSDEFLNEHPRRAIDIANTERADFIRAYQMTFMLTERDVFNIENGTDDRRTPITERRKHYRVDWREYRLFRNDPTQAWDIQLNPQFPQTLSKRRVASASLFNRHYQFRDVEQVKARLALRADNPAFAHVSDAEWRACIVPARRCHLHSEGADVQFSPIADFWWPRIKLEVSQRLGLAPKAA